MSERSARRQRRAAAGGADDEAAATDDVGAAPPPLPPPLPPASPIPDLPLDLLTRIVEATGGSTDVAGLVYSCKAGQEAFAAIERSSGLAHLRMNFRGGGRASVAARHASARLWLGRHGAYLRSADVDLTFTGRDFGGANSEAVAAALAAAAQQGGGLQKLTLRLHGQQRLMEEETLPRSSEGWACEMHVGRQA